MRLIRSWKSVCLLAFLTNLATLFYMLTRLDPKCRCVNEEVVGIKISETSRSSSSTSRDSRLSPQDVGVALHSPEAVILDANQVREVENSVTVIIREFEAFENDVVQTVGSVLAVFPNISLLIVTDQVLYPPLKLHQLNVYKDMNLKVVSLTSEPNRPVNETQPLHFITTKYVLLLPDSLRMGHSSIENIYYMLIEVNKAPGTIIASEAIRDRRSCLELKVDLRRWTLTYRHSTERTDGMLICDALGLEGSHVLLMSKNLLSLQSHPWARPFPFAIYVQTALRKVKIHLLKDISFESGEKLFKGEHNRMKHDAYSSSRKIEFFHSFGIKRVVHPKGDITSYGCSKTTPRCFGTVVDDMPDYLFRERWTPPCCLEHLRETARHVFQILDKCEVRYWLEGGSLLGAVRYEDIIPWDYDIDLGIYKEDINKCKWLKNAQNQSFVDMQGFVWEKAREGDFLRVQYSQTNHLHVDIFPFYAKNGIMTKDTWFTSHKQDTEFPERYLKPLLKTKFIGIYVSAPNNIREFLEFKFGKGVIENPQYPMPDVLKFPKNGTHPNKIV